jgi:hypothetical protein
VTRTLSTPDGVVAVVLVGPACCLADQATAPWLLLNLADAEVTHPQLRSRFMAPAVLTGQVAGLFSSNSDVKAPERVWLSFLVGRPVAADP